MKLKCSPFFCVLLLIMTSLYANDDFFIKQELFPCYRDKKDDSFIAKRQQLRLYYGYKNILLIASPGRSGSTLLTEMTKKYAKNYKVLKTHLLPPDARYKGKILFIFSNPDKAAESALHMILGSRSHGATHFSHVETADQKWFDEIGRNASYQTEEHNLLAYDALGCTKQLKQWLYGKLESCHWSEAQVLAIKYEHLWEAATTQAIKKFLGLKSFKLPPQKNRGKEEKELFPEEVIFRRLYNVGTKDEPLYHAYDEARELWEKTPSFQFLKIKP